MLFVCQARSSAVNMEFRDLQLVVITCRVKCMLNITGPFKQHMHAMLHCCYKWLYDRSYNRCLAECCRHLRILVKQRWHSHSTD